MRAIAYRGFPVAVEKSVPAIRRGHVLVRVVEAFIGSVENLVVRGVVAPHYGVVLGFEGMGKVIEVGVDGDHHLSGKHVYLSHVDCDRLPGYSADGFLAEYVALPSGSVEPVPPGLIGSVPYPTSAGIAATAAGTLLKRGVKRVLVAGAGPSGLALYALLRGRVAEVLVYSRRLCAGSLKVKDVEHVCDVSREAPFDAIFVSMLPSQMPYVSLREGGLVLVHPLVECLSSFKLRVSSSRYLVRVVRHASLSRGLPEGRVATFEELLRRYLDYYVLRADGPVFAAGWLKVVTKGDAAVPAASGRR